jgi:phosphoribosylglycinamide formyltransferase-1
VVVGNVQGVLGLSKAEKYGYPNYYRPDNDGINAVLRDYEIDIVCLAGYLKLYTPPPKLARSVLNIHPSLIPSFCGAGFYGHHVHQAVKDRGCMISGCTVHFADGNYDEGPIILQKSVELAYDDDADSIAAKVFAIECEAFPEAINRVDERGVDFFWQRVRGAK